MGREDELFRKLNSGDSSALDELIRIYYPEILRYCLWHTSDRQTADDATQETFLKAVRHLDSYIHHGKFRAFLYTIAVNTCNDLWRQSKMQIPYEHEEYTEPGFAQAESDMSMKKMLDTLPDGQREVVILRLAFPFTAHFLYSGAHLKNYRSFYSNTFGLATISKPCKPVSTTLFWLDAQ